MRTGLEILMMVIMAVNSGSLEEDHFINFRRLARTCSVSDPGLGTRVPMRKPSSAALSALTGLCAPDTGTRQCGVITGAVTAGGPFRATDGGPAEPQM